MKHLQEKLHLPLTSTILKLEFYIMIFGASHRHKNNISTQRVKTSGNPEVSQTHLAISMTFPSPSTLICTKVAPSFSPMLCFMIHCVLNNIAFKIFLREHIFYRLSIFNFRVMVTQRSRQFEHGLAVILGGLNGTQ